MTLPVWPAGFRLPLRQGSDFRLPRLKQSTEFPVGSRDRPLYQDDSDPFDNLAVLLDGPQCDRLRGFYRYDLFEGSGYFLMPLNVNGTVVQREVKFTTEPSFEPRGPRYWRVTIPVKTRYGTTITREQYEDLIGVIGFEDFVQTLIVPSDTAIINPAAGDSAPGAPIPWLGLYLPFGARIALEGNDGVVAPIELPPNTRFTGLIPRRLLVIGTDSDAVVYGLSHPSVTALPANSGNRIITVVPSDTVGLPLPAVGGLYTQSGGAFSYASTTGAGSAVLPPKRWTAAPEFTRVNAAGTDAGFSAVAFVRAP